MHQIIQSISILTLFQSRKDIVTIAMGRTKFYVFNTIMDEKAQNTEDIAIISQTAC